MAAQGSGAIGPFMQALPSDDSDLDDPQGQQAAGSTANGGNPFPAGSPLGSSSPMVMSGEQVTAVLLQLHQTTQLLAQSVGQSSSSQAQRAITGREMSKILPKPEPFRSLSREQECSAWPSWVWSLEQYLGVLDASFTDEIAALRSSLHMPALAMNADTRVRSKQLYAMLSVLVKGRGFLVVKGIQDGNGYEALRRLINLYAPQSQSRSLGILTALTQVTAFKTSEALMPQILDLERVFAEYEAAAQQQLQEALKTALLIRCVPNSVKNQLHASLPEDASYDVIREAIFRIERQSFKWQGVTFFGTGQQEPVPMEIDAVTKGPKGRGRGGKGKGGKGKAGGGKRRPDYQPPHGGGKDNSKGKYGKGKDVKGAKGNEAKGRGGKPKVDKSQVQCFNCGRKGHYAADCWRSKGGASVSQVVQPPDGSSQSSTADPSASQVMVSQTSVPHAKASAVCRVEVDLSTIGSSDGYVSMIQAVEMPTHDPAFLDVVRALQFCPENVLTSSPTGGFPPLLGTFGPAVSSEPRLASVCAFIPGPCKVSGCTCKVPCKVPECTCKVPCKVACKVQCKVSGCTCKVPCKVSGCACKDPCKVTCKVPECTCKVPCKVSECACKVPCKVSGCTCKVPCKVSECTCKVPYNMPGAEACEVPHTPCLAGASNVTQHIAPFPDVPCFPGVQGHFTCQCEVFDMTYSDDDEQWLYSDESLASCMHAVRAVRAVPSHVFEQVEIVLDSGADHSCLPEKYAKVGGKPATSNMVFRDAQGNPLASQGTREAKVDLDSVTIKERWLIAPVTAPLLSLGKLYKKGWTVSRDEQNNLSLQRDGISVPVHMKQNSLCVRGDIRMLASEDSSLQGESNRFHVRAVNLYGQWLTLRDQFECLVEGLYAMRCTTSSLVDCATALARYPVVYRTTLLNSPSGWKLYELNQLISDLDDPEVALPYYGMERMHDAITIASAAKINMQELFPGSELGIRPPAVGSESDDDPMIPVEPEQQHIFEDGVNAGQVPGSLQVEPEGDDQMAANPAAPLVVDGVRLSLDCSLATLRLACRTLGIGRSGGKATVLKRIEDHLRKQSLLERHVIVQEALNKPVEANEQPAVAPPTEEEHTVQERTGVRQRARMVAPAPHSRLTMHILPVQVIRNASSFALWESMPIQVPKSHGPCRQREVTRH